MQDQNLRGYSRGNFSCHSCLKGMEKALLVYVSALGNTAKVVQRVPALLSFPIEIVNVCSLTDGSLFRAYDLLLFFVSTAGDQELQQDMERFLARHLPRLDDKSYAICELGNHFGYDDFDFGAEPVLSHFLRTGGGRELVPPFSMDSFPIKDWKNLTRWCDLLNRAVATAHA